MTTDPNEAKGLIIMHFLRRKGGSLRVFRRIRTNRMGQRGTQLPPLEFGEPADFSFLWR